MTDHTTSKLFGEFDLAIIGGIGGIDGLATAVQLLTARPDTRLAVIEAEPHVGMHQSGHNSGVPIANRGR